MTGVAAQWCGTAPESYRKTIEVQWSKEGFGKPNWGLRRTIQNDLSPLAGFIAANYGLPFDLDAFAEAGQTLLAEVTDELGWMYETLHTDGKTKGRIDYTVWSEVFSCPECAGEVVFTDEALDETSGRVRDTFPCPHCGSELTKRRVERLYESHFDPSINATVRVPRLKPVMLFYSLGGMTHRKSVEASDLEILERINRLPLPMEVPSVLIPPMHMTHERARMEYSGITHIHHFFLPRAAHALAARGCGVGLTHTRTFGSATCFFSSWNRPSGGCLSSIGTALRIITQVNRQLTGVYYVSSQIAEVSPKYNLGKQAFPTEQDLRRVARTTEFWMHCDGKHDSVDRDSEQLRGLHLHRPTLRREHLLRRSQLPGRILAPGTDQCTVPEAIVDRFKKKGAPRVINV